MAYIAKRLFPASGYVVDKGDYVPTEVIGQAATTLESTGYVVEVPDDTDKDEQFYNERGDEFMPQDHSDPREIIPGVVPLPYETHSNLEADPTAVEDDENSEGARVLDPSSAAAGGMVGMDQGEVGGSETEADDEVAQANADANATQGAKDLANSEGILLSDVEGSGDDGRIVKGDVEQYLVDES